MVGEDETVEQHPVRDQASAPPPPPPAAAAAAAAAAAIDSQRHRAGTGGNRHQTSRAPRFQRAATSQVPTLDCLDTQRSVLDSQGFID